MSNTRDRRKADRERKAEERKARREAGIPEPAALDKALVDALRDALSRRRWRIVRRRSDGSVLEIVPSLHGTLFLARKALLARGLNRAAIDGAIRDRLRTATDAEEVPPPAPQAEAPSQIASLKAQPPAEMAPSGHDADVQKMLDDLLGVWETADA